jgi:transposase
MKKQRRFSREFKQEAVRLMSDSGRSVAEIGEELGVSTNSLYRW